MFKYHDGFCKTTRFFDFLHNLGVVQSAQVDIRSFEFFRGITDPYTIDPDLDIIHTPVEGGIYAFLMGTCAGLDQTLRNCRIYDKRPLPCRNFLMGGKPCQEIRRGAEIEAVSVFR